MVHLKKHLKTNKVEWRDKEINCNRLLKSVFAVFTISPSISNRALCVWQKLKRFRNNVYNILVL